jgi:hypothetical protein
MRLELISSENILLCLHSPRKEKQDSHIESCPMILTCEKSNWMTGHDSGYAFCM